VKVSYLIDTDWIIFQLKGNKQIQSRLIQLQSGGLGISIISLAELYEGIIHSRDTIGNQKKLDDFLSSVIIFDITEEICKLFGSYRGFLRKQGLMISDFDLIIAMTCLHHDLTLLTNNRKHFERIKELKIISID
jgi:predicted nucleic acid-binding protein